MLVLAGFGAVLTLEELADLAGTEGVLFGDGATPESLRKGDGFQVFFRGDTFTVEAVNNATRVFGSVPEDLERGEYPKTLGFIFINRYKFEEKKSFFRTRTLYTYMSVESNSTTENLRVLIERLGRKPRASLIYCE